MANIAHMATHYGFTKCYPLNFIAEYVFDLSGMSGLEWQITHQTHHNQPHSSIDHQTNVYDYVGVRLHQYKKLRNYHKYQYLYFWLSVSPYLLFKFFVTTAWLFMNKQFVRHRYEMVAHFMARGVLLTQVVYCAYVQGIWTAVMLLSLYSIFYSQTAFILLFNDYEDTHKLLGDNEDVGVFHNKMSWAEVQVRTSNNWYPTNWISTFFQFHYGYFNYHIEHHLFPTFKPSLLKKISPIVKSLCRKHNIPYISTPFMDVQKSLQGHITKMGTRPLRDEMNGGSKASPSASRG
jgi:fatty acid desaturase